MYRKLSIKITYVIFFAVFLFGLAACERENIGYEHEALLAGYEKLSLIADFEDENYSDMKICPPYALFLHRNENIADEYKFSFYNLGDKKVEQTVSIKNEHPIVDFAFDGEKTLYILSLLETASREITYFLKGYDMSSELLTDIVLPKIDIDDIARSCLVKDETLYLQFKKAYAEIDICCNEIVKQGKFTTTISLAQTANGQIVLGENKGDKFKITYLASQTEKIIDGSFSSVLSGSGAYEMLLTDGDGIIFGLISDKSDIRPIMNYKTQGLGVESDIGIIDDKKILAISNGTPVIFSPSAKDNSVITIAGYGDSFVLSSAVSSFNKISDTKIVFKNYANYDIVEGDATGLDLLKTEIIAGKIPDIIDLSAIGYYNALSLGLLENLSPYLNNNLDVKNDYLDNVLACYSDGEEIYNLLPTFIISTVVKEKEKGDSGWTISEFLEFAKQLESPAKAFGSKFTQSEFIEYVLAINSTEYVDYENGKCNFESTDFRELLTFANQLPSKPADNNLYSTSMLFTGDSSCLVSGMTGIETLIGIKPLFKKDYEYKGFPSQDEAMGRILPIINLGMSSRSERKDEVWHFFEFLLSEEYQNELLLSIPVNKNAFWERIEKDVQISEKTFKIGFSVNEMVYELDTLPLDKTDVQRFSELVYSLNRPIYNDEKLAQIVQEEAAAFFAGERSAEDTARLIQSRVSLYLAEQG